MTLSGVATPDNVMNSLTGSAPDRPLQVGSQSAPSGRPHDGRARQGGGSEEKGTDMKTQQIQRRNAWRALSRQDKHQRLEALRAQQHRHVQHEILRLQAVR